MATQRPRKLGRGLSSLLEESAQPAEIQPPHNEGKERTEQIREIPIDQVRPSAFQPRIRFHDREMAELAASIRSAGLMQPIVVRALGPDRFELIAGERRLRAAKLAGLTTIPAIVREADDRQAAELALIENVQRSDLNPIERARAFRSLMETFSMTQAEVADRVGLDRSSVANLLRLLDLPEDVRNMIGDGIISAGHGKMLASITDAQQLRALVERIVREHLSVRQTEKAVREMAQRSRQASKNPTPTQETDRNANLQDLERRLGEHLKTKVRIELATGGQKGRIVVDFYDLEHFDGLMRAMGFENS